MGNVEHEPDALIPIVSEAYDLSGTVGVELIRAGFNHNYRVQAGDDAFVLRMYLNDKYYIDSPDDFRFELELLAFLKNQNIPVADAVKNVQGDYLSTSVIGEETRHMALFPFAQGDAVEKLSLSSEQITQLSEHVARFHVAVDRFQCEHSRYHLNRRYLLDEPLERLEGFLQKYNLDALDFAKPLVDKLDTLLNSWPQTQPGYGYIHGDFNGSNILFDEAKGFTLLDFDHSAFGWRGYDLAIFAQDKKEWPTFLESYESVRPLEEWEHEVISHGRTLRDLWDIGDILNMSIFAWDHEPSEKYVKECLETIQELVASEIENA